MDDPGARSCDCSAPFLYDENYGVICAASTSNR